MDDLEKEKQSELKGKVVRWRCGKCKKEIQANSNIVLGFAQTWKDSIDTYCEECWEKHIKKCFNFAVPFDLHASFEKVEIHKRPSELGGHNG